MNLRVCPKVIYLSTFSCLVADVAWFLLLQGSLRDAIQVEQRVLDATKDQETCLKEIVSITRSRRTCYIRCIRTSTITSLNYCIKLTRFYSIYFTGAHNRPLLSYRGRDLTWRYNYWVLLSDLRIPLFISMSTGPSGAVTRISSEFVQCSVVNYSIFDPNTLQVIYGIHQGDAITEKDTRKAPLSKKSNVGSCG